MAPKIKISPFKELQERHGLLFLELQEAKREIIRLRAQVQGYQEKLLQRPVAA